MQDGHIRGGGWKTLLLQQQLGQMAGRDGISTAIGGRVWRAGAAAVLAGATRWTALGHRKQSAPGLCGMQAGVSNQGYANATAERTR